MNSEQIVPLESCYLLGNVKKIALDGGSRAYRPPHVGTGDNAIASVRLSARLFPL